MKTGGNGWSGGRRGRGDGEEEVTSEETIRGLRALVSILLSWAEVGKLQRTRSREVGGSALGEPHRKVSLAAEWGTGYRVRAEAGRPGSSCCSQPER